MDAAVAAATVSACVAAGALLLTTVANVVGGGKNEARSAHRELLGAYLAQLGRDIKGVVAASTVYQERVLAGKSLEGWRSRAIMHGNSLNDLRADVRYLLYGLDDGLRDLSRVAGWIQHFNDMPEKAQVVLASADLLRGTLDSTIARSYRRGEPPSSRDQRRVANAARDLRDAWEDRMTSQTNS